MSAMSSHSVYQVNLQNQFGGGEVYTRFFTMALIDLGYRVVLFVSRKADFWESLLPAGVELVRVGGPAEILRRLPQAKSLVVTQTALDAAAAQWVAKRHVLCGFVHMPLYERNPPGFSHYHLLLAVSRHVLDSIRWRGYGNDYAQPMYGVAARRMPRRATRLSRARNTIGIGASCATACSDWLSRGGGCASLWWCSRNGPVSRWASSRG